MRRVSIVASAVLLATSLAWAPTNASPPPPPSADDSYGVYRGVVDAQGLSALLALGVDRHEIEITPGGDGTQVNVEVILSGAQAAQVERAGGDLTRVEVAAADQITTLEEPEPVFRPYSGEGGLEEEMHLQVESHPRIAELVVIGHTVRGQDIVAVRVTKHPHHVREGSRPTTVYTGAQHAREWITPEMVRRLLDLVLDGYGVDPEITKLVNTTEMWFVPVVNPDGYDHTFTTDRLWRKNLRDNNGDGIITPGDGVDLNRNMPTRWGYDNEGSSPDPASETYRGPSPGSEPESRAMDQLFARITPEFFVNYHSAAELLLYGIGWQVATPGPDDIVYEALAGDDANPAVPGYDPDISAELYTTNGDIDTHMQEAHGTLGFTPEMSTCEAASDSDPNDEWFAEDCESGFNFPDDETLIQAEFAKNVPFALSVAKSAKDPDDPVSVVGREAEDFRIDPFDVSYGGDQEVAVVAKRSLHHRRLHYRINGGRIHTARVQEWGGGERYGFENDVYYAEYRGTVHADPGDTVEVWFSGKKPWRDEHGRIRGLRRVTSEHFTYDVHQDTGNRVLVLANEDHTGFNPEVPGEDEPAGALEHLDDHRAAYEANGVATDVWDVDAQGVPHHLGVLSHYDLVHWYLGDNRLTQDAEDFFTEIGDPAAPALVPHASVAERQQYLTIAIRDFLNEGGKLAHDGETTAYYGFLGVGGLFYGLNGAPEQECQIERFADECLLLTDDFTQYYLGAYARTALDTASGVVGTVGPTTGRQAAFGGPALVDNPVDEPGGFTVTSDVLDPAEFPQFTSRTAAEYVGAHGDFIPVEGSVAAFAAHADSSWMRLGRTFDLTGLTAADVPTLQAMFSFDTEAGYDHVIVEAHTVGQDDWTTLPDRDGATTEAVPLDCEFGFLLEQHPFLTEYLVPGDPAVPTPCTPVAPGAWNAFSGYSDGWVPVAFDLSAYAGAEVEVFISYVADPFVAFTGLMVDDTELVTTAGTLEAEGFEAGFGAWTVPGQPEGSPDNAGDFELSQGTINAVVSTPDTVLFGFGLEQLEDPAARATVVGAILAHLLAS